jgi:hypothetical protein
MIHNNPKNEMITPHVCRRVILSLNRINENKTINIGVMAFTKIALTAIVDCRAKYINESKMVTEKMARSVMIFQWLRIKTHSLLSGFTAKGRIIINAMAQRQKDMAIGGITSWTPLPRTKFPDQKRTVNVRSR